MLAERFGMRWRIAYARRSPPRRADGLARADHCLLDLLWRNRRGELEMERDLRDLESRAARRRGRAPRRPVRAHPGQPGHDARRPSSAHSIVLAGRAELLVLARYMRILSGGFLSRIACPVINIHHSFLPAFAGAEPYRQALSAA